MGTVVYSKQTTENVCYHYGRKIMFAWTVGRTSALLLIIVATLVADGGSLQLAHYSLYPGKVALE